MLKILQSYIDVAFLLKLAKLNDAQYQLIYNDRNLKQKLYDKNLLDLYYMSKPLMSEQEIDAQLAQDNKDKNAQEIIAENLQIKTFVAKYGNQFLDDRFREGIEKFISQLLDKSYAVGNIEEIASGVKSYSSNIKLKDFIFDYIASKNSSLKILNDFVTNYMDIMNLNIINKQDPKLQKVVSNFYTMVNFILTSEDVSDVIKTNFDDAKKIRQSDIFDFVLENYTKPEIKPIQPQQPSTPMSPHVINREDKTKK